jgi:DNA segregation ATPase FtsK/SpoIIIE-like protein
MAGSDSDSGASKSRKNEHKRQKERVGPGLNADIAQGASRVSRAAGSIGSQSVSVEQRSNSTPTPATKAKSSQRRPVVTEASAKQAQSSRRSTRKRSSSGRSAPAPTRDIRFIDWLRKGWANMEPHHQQRFLSLLLLACSLLLLAALTILRTFPLLTVLHNFFFTFFGWSAYLLAFGLIAFAIAHLIEGMFNKRLIRWSLVIGLIVLWLLVLAESNLLFGRMTGGVVGALMVIPLKGWNGPFSHVLLIGLVIIVAILTFRIRFGHLLALGHVIGQGVSAGTGKRASTAGSSRRPSPFLGQRPQYSRYVPVSQAAGQAANMQADEDDETVEDGEDIVDFESDFDEAEDPRNDINLHKQEIGMVPRGPRSVQPLDQQEHNAAVQGARQQRLPFDQARAEIEPLAPNPARKNQPVVNTRAAGAQAGDGPPWKLPDIKMLNSPEEVKLHMMGDDTASLAKTIQETLRSFHVEAEVREADISIGPTVVRFGIRPTGKPQIRMDEKGKPTPVRDAAGNIVYETRTKVSRILALQNDLALVLEAKSIRMEAPVPGRPYVGVEIPNKNSRLVTLREVLESKEYLAAKAKSRLTVALGKDVAGTVRVADLARMPHLLIAGATGAGKSVSINAIIGSILMQATPADVRILMVDPKMVELVMYNGIPHLLTPVVTEVEKVVALLKMAIAEMEKRYRRFSQLGVRNLDGYRKQRLERLSHGDTSLENLPAIVIIIDELADLMMSAPEEIEGMICRLAQLARATGIHLVIATQRPSVDVITGLIKANIPTRISFMVSSAVDSRTIIDMGGAERLLGRGDMLYLPADAGKPERIQGAFVADDEVDDIVSFWKHQKAERDALLNQSKNAKNAASMPPEVEPAWQIDNYISDDFDLEDDLLEEAERVVREYERASISLLQRRLRIGYSRAARLIDLLEEQGIIGPSEAGGRSREVFDDDFGGGQHGRRGNGEGHSLADEAADIAAEQKAREEFLKAREEFLKKQGTAQQKQPPNGQQSSASN